MFSYYNKLANFWLFCLKLQNKHEKPFFKKIFVSPKAILGTCGYMSNKIYLNFGWTSPSNWWQNSWEGFSDYHEKQFPGGMYNWKNHLITVLEMMLNNHFASCYVRYKLIRKNENLSKISESNSSYDIES